MRGAGRARARHEADAVAHLVRYVDRGAHRVHRQRARAKIPKHGKATQPVCVPTRAIAREERLRAQRAHFKHAAVKGRRHVEAPIRVRGDPKRKTQQATRRQRGGGTVGRHKAHLICRLLYHRKNPRSAAPRNTARLVEARGSAHAVKAESPVCGEKCAQARKGRHGSAAQNSNTIQVALTKVDGIPAATRKRHAPHVSERCFGECGAVGARVVYRPIEWVCAAAVARNRGNDAAGRYQPEAAVAHVGDHHGAVAAQGHARGRIEPRVGAHAVCVAYRPAREGGDATAAQNSHAEARAARIAICKDKGGTIQGKP